MPRTTSLTTLSRLSILATSAIVAGCGTEPSVQGSLRPQPLAAQPVPSPGSGLAAISGQTTFSTDPLNQRLVFFGSAKAEAESALRRIEISRREAVERAAAELGKNLLKQTQADNEERLAALQQEFRKRDAITDATLRSVFVRYARVTGPLRTKLAWQAGVPDPDPASRRNADRASFTEKPYVRGARRTREEIRALARDLGAELVGTYESANTEFRLAMANEMADGVRRLDRAEQDAARIRERMLAETNIAVSEPLLEDFASYAALPRVTVKTPSINFVREEWPVVRRSGWTPGQRDKAMRKLFAAVRPVTLAEGGQDMTQEFRQWRTSAIGR